MRNKKSSIHWVSDKNHIVIDVNYDDILRKKITNAGFKYQPTLKKYTKIFKPDDVPFLVSLHPVLKMSEEYGMLIRKHGWILEALSCHRDREGLGIEIPSLKRDLYPTQKVAVKFIRANQGRCILGDEQRVGKTYPPLVYFYEIKKKTVILCPLHLVQNWKNEISELFWEDVSEYFKVISFDSHKEIEQAREWAEAVVIDEFHLMSDLKSKRFQAAYSLSKNLPYLILITGNSIKYWPVDFYSALKILKKDFTKETYIKRFFSYIFEDNRLKIQDLKEEMLKNYISTFYLRRKLSDISPESKGVNHIHEIRLTPEEMSVYHDKIKHRGLIFNGISARDINQTLSHLKIKHLVKYCVHEIKMNPNKKIAICSQFPEVIEEIKRAMPYFRAYPELADHLLLDTSHFREGIDLSGYSLFIMLDVYANYAHNIQIKRRFLSPEVKSPVDCVYFTAGLFDKDLILMPDIHDYQKSLKYLSEKLFVYESSLTRPKAS